MHTDRIWRYLCFRMPFLWSWASKERRNEKLKCQLEKGRLPHVHRSAWFPTLDVILRGRKLKITKHQYLKTWKILAGLGFDKYFNSYRECVSCVSSSHRWMSWRKPFYVQFVARRQQADVLNIEASAFAKKNPKLSDNYFCIGKD